MVSFMPSTTKSSLCLVVCFPLWDFLLMSPVSIMAPGISLFMIVDLPTPEAPASATDLPAISLLSSSMPSSRSRLMHTTGYSGEYISCKSSLLPLRSHLLMHMMISAPALSAITANLSIVWRTGFGFAAAATMAKQSTFATKGRMKLFLLGRISVIRLSSLSGMTSISTESPTAGLMPRSLKIPLALHLYTVSPDFT